MTENRARPDAFRAHVPPEVREHMKSARAEMRKGLQTLLPGDFFVHRDAARREMLLAWRGVLDEAIRRLDTKE
jgi:hypothetical protein